MDPSHGGYRAPLRIAARRRCKGISSGLCAVVFALSGSAWAQDDVATLRRQLEEQRAQIEQQRATIREQQRALDERAQQLDDISRRLAEIEKSAPSGGAVAVAPGAAAGASGQSAAADSVSKTYESFQRDPVGDLNAAAVRAGEFPGSILLPGAGVSLAIGGFVKAVAIADSDAEAAGAAFLPAFLGTARNDTDGNFSIDSALTRLDFDARYKTRNSALRGYIEFDGNGRNDGSLNMKFRHAYAAWTNPRGTLTAGHTWSTLMDLKVLPNGLTEPTVSGAIFNRQPMVRWSQTLNERLKFDVAFEDPSSDDVYGGAPSAGRVSRPDLIGAVELGTGSRGHLRVGAIRRTLEADTASGGASAHGWGITVSGHRRFLDKDRLYFQADYGEGLGRYLLGLQSASGAALDPVDDLVTRKNYGGFVGYEHAWNESLSSSAVFGRAKADRLDFQPLNEFESSSFVLLNLMWKILPQLSLGVEYGYGSRDNADGTGLDNHRLMIGVQFY